MLILLLKDNYALNYDISDTPKERNSLTRLTQKFLKFCLIALMGVVPLNLSYAQAEFRFPSTSGSFLAGQAALKGLSTREAASSLMSAARAEWNNSSAVERAFVALVADGRIPEAGAVAKHVLELRPANSLAKLVLATIALKERRYSSVLTLTQGLGFSDFIAISGSIVRAWAFVGQSSLDGAFDELSNTSNGALDNFLVFHRALMADLVGDERALELTRQTYASDSFLGRVVEFRARVLGNDGQRAAALDVLDKFELEGLTYPSLPSVRQQLNAGRLPGKYVTSIPQGAAEIFQGIGAALGRDGNVDIAVVFLRLGLYLNPQADTITLSLAQFLEGAQRYEQAIEIYAAIDKNSKFKPEATVRIAQDIDKLGDRPDAIRRLKNIVALQPDNLLAISALGDLYRIDAQFDEAENAYSMALDLVGGDHPRDWRFYYLRGIANEQRGVWEEAESDFLKALELVPTQPQVLNYLGYSWVDKGMNLTRALDMLEQAVSTNPGDGYIIDSLGWALFKLHKFDEAVNVLEQAVELSPNDPEINDHLGDAYWRAGRHREARFQWTIARTVDEKGNVFQRTISKLEEGMPPVGPAPVFEENSGNS